MNLTRKMNQNAIYWASTVPDGYGNDSFSSPVDVAVRWEYKQELFIDAKGEEHVSMAFVYAITTFVLGGFLQLAEVDSVTPSTPIGVTGAFPIRSLLKTPSVRGDQILYRAIL